MTTVSVTYPRRPLPGSPVKAQNLPVGRTIAELVGLVLPQLSDSTAATLVMVKLEGEIIPSAFWSKIRPKAGARVFVQIRSDGCAAFRFVAAAGLQAPHTVQVLDAARKVREMQKTKRPTITVSAAALEEAERKRRAGQAIAPAGPSPWAKAEPQPAPRPQTLVELLDEQATAGAARPARRRSAE